MILKAVSCVVLTCKICLSEKEARRRKKGKLSVEIRFIKIVIHSKIKAYIVCLVCDPKKRRKKEILSETFFPASKPKNQSCTAKKKVHSSTDLAFA